MCLRFHLKLIVCYELYTTGKLDDSLKEMEDFVNSMEVTKFSDSDAQYTDAYNHILKSSFAFIAVSMNHNNFDKVCHIILKIIDTRHTLRMFFVGMRSYSSFYFYFHINIYNYQ